MITFIIKMANKSTPREPIYSGGDLTFIFLLYFGMPVITIAWLGIKTGFVSIVVCLLTKWFVTSRILKLTALTIQDEMFLLDFPENRANILTVMKLQKVGDPENLRSFLIDKITAFDRCRSKLIKVCHEYYFKQLSDRELAKATSDCFKVLPDGQITSESDLVAFLEHE